MSSSFRLVPGGLVALLFLMTASAAARDDAAFERPTAITVDSEILGEKRTLVVTLPANYPGGTERYPVLYHLDAGTAGESPLAPERHLFPAMITVGIVNTDRDRDMFPVFVGPKRPTSGGADRFLHFLTNEVIPLVDREYRTSNQRILYGMSNSALFTVYALTEQPEAFAGFIASSPMIGWCFDFMRDRAETFVKSGASVDALLFIIYGDDDSSRVVDAVPPFIEILESEPLPGLRWEVHVIEDGGHVPPESLARGLDAFFAPQP